MAVDDNQAESDLADEDAAFSALAHRIADERGIPFEEALHVAEEQVYGSGTPAPAPVAKPRRQSRAQTAKPRPEITTVPVAAVVDDPWSEEAQILAWESVGLDTSDAQGTIDAVRLRESEHRREAIRNRNDAHESFERSDTDGFMSQWASGVSAQQRELDALIAQHGGTYPFPALTRDGELVPARLVETKYGMKWAVYANAEDANTPYAKAVEWVPGDPEKAERKGYRIAQQTRPAKTALGGNTAVNVRPYAYPSDNMKFNPLAPVCFRD